MTTGDYLTGLYYLARYGKENHLSELKSLIEKNQRHLLLLPNPLGRRPIDGFDKNNNLSEEFCESLKAFVDEDVNSENEASSSSYASVRERSKGKEAEKNPSKGFKEVEGGFTKDHTKHPGNVWIIPRSSNTLEKSVCNLHLAIFPTRDNILRAMSALNSVIENLKRIPEFKIFMPSMERGLKSWDITLDGIKDQRGTELCLTIEYDKGYPLTSQEYKEIMLKLWKAMEIHGVDVGYTVPFGDNEIPTEKGITSPFSYSKVEDFTENHKNDRPNPFKHICITWNDIARHDIQGFSEKDSAQGRVNYYYKHLALAKEKLLGDFDTLARVDSPYNIMGILNKVKDYSDEKLADFFSEKGLFNKIKSYFPHKSDSKFSLIYDIDIHTYDPKKQRVKIKELIFLYKIIDKENQEAIINNKGFMNFFMAQNLQWDKNSIHFMVHRDCPYEMQKLYRRFVHIQHEEKILACERGKTYKDYSLEYYKDFFDNIKRDLNSSVWPVGIFEFEDATVTALRDVLNKPARNRKEEQRVKYYQVVALLQQLKLKGNDLTQAQAPQVENWRTQSTSVKIAVKTLKRKISDANSDREDKTEHVKKLTGQEGFNKILAQLRRYENTLSKEPHEYYEKEFKSYITESLETIGSGDVDVTAVDKRGWNLLHFMATRATENELDQALGYLKEDKMKILNAKTNESQFTPLHLAFDRKNFKLVLPLIRAGADIHAINKKGFSSFDKITDLFMSDIRYSCNDYSNHYFLEIKKIKYRPLVNPTLQGILTSVKNQTLQEADAARNETWEHLYKVIKPLIVLGCYHNQDRETTFRVLEAVKKILTVASMKNAFTAHKYETGNARETFCSGVSTLVSIGSSSMAKSWEREGMAKPKKLLVDCITLCQEEIARLEAPSNNTSRRNSK